MKCGLCAHGEKLHMFLAKCGLISVYVCAYIGDGDKLVSLTPGYLDKTYPMCRCYDIIVVTKF